jgi:hypothetical protein
MDEKDRERDLLRARISKTLMSIAKILLDPGLSSMAEILISLDEVMEEFNGLREELREKYKRERLIRPPPMKNSDTPIPPSPRVPKKTLRPCRPITKKRATVPPPTKGRRR